MWGSAAGPGQAGLPFLPPVLEEVVKYLAALGLAPTL